MATAKKVLIALAAALITAGVSTISFAAEDEPLPLKPFPEEPLPLKPFPVCINVLGYYVCFG